MRYFGISNVLAEEENEQKLEDALKVMTFLATEEGQQSLMQRVDNYVASLKNTVIPEDSPFHEVTEVLQNGHPANLAYAGYEPIIIDAGIKVRYWVAGNCTVDDVLVLMDSLQSEYLKSGREPAVVVAAQDFTLEETTQIQAEALRTVTDTDIGMVSMGGYYKGVENPSGVCDQIFQGDLTLGTIAVVQASILTQFAF